MNTAATPMTAPLCLNTVVIGAGQAGLAAGYYLQQRGVSFLILEERAAVGDVWATRYDSLRLFSPAWASNLPGLPWTGNARRYPTKDEAANYLRQYAQHYALPIETGQRVIALQPAASGFTIVTATGRQFSAQRVIVCTGPYTAPRIPDWHQQLPSTIQQLHSSAYLRPSQLQGSGSVAVIGSGNSALQIAADIAATGRTVFAAFDEKTPAMPNNTVMWELLLTTHLLEAGRNTWVGRLMHGSPEPVVSKDLHKLRRFPNVHFIGRAVGADADARIKGRTASTLPVTAVIWATGFAPDYAWLHVPGALAPDGRQPLHTRGLSPIAGLAFLGLPWLHSRRSALMGGADADAQYVVEHLLKRT